MKNEVVLKPKEQDNNIIGFLVTDDESGFIADINLEELRIINKIHFPYIISWEKKQI